MVDKIKELWRDYRQNLTKKAVLKTAWHYFLMVVGNALLAFGTSVFLLPYKVVTGGVSGLALIFTEFFNINTELMITILTWVLFIVGLLLLGVRFSLKTLVATLIYPPLVFVFSLLRDNVTWLQLTADTTGKLLAGIFGGVFVGAGCAVTYIGGGSTGGVDCISLALNKYTRIKASVASFIIDSSIIVGGLVAYKDLTLALIGIMSAFVCALMIDRIFLGNSASYVAFIVTNKYAEINSAINDKLERGTTLIYAEGGFTGDQTKMIQVAFDRKEYADIQAIVGKIDPKAFMSIVHAYEVNGYGFKKMPQAHTKRRPKNFDSEEIQNLPDQENKE